jgi:cell division protein FtsI/penicillin-binding protein 2
MNRQFPYNDFGSRKRTGRRFRLRYLLLPLILVAISLFFLPEIKGGAEVLVKHEPGLNKQELARITPETIRSRNLTLNWDLQNFISETAIKYKVHYGAIAVMDAHTGDVLALYGKNVTGQDCTLGLEPELAASIFKLVTAIAAMDQGGMNSNSTFTYSGNAHTLYKNQLLDRKNRWTANITLADAFARSNNVVFGKLGTIYLGETPIYLTALKLGFWKNPLKECESAPSTIFFPQDEYSLAELSCGFNRLTRISPLHAAEIVTPVFNNGNMITPRIIRDVPVEQIPVMSRETSRNLSSMMERTVKTGTVSKRFRGASSDRVLRQLVIGAKSGSIDGDQPAGRRNWFVGYAQNINTGEAITIGCLLIRDDRFWIEADTFSRLIFRHYFSKPVTMAQQNSANQNPKQDRLGKKI